MNEKIQIAIYNPLWKNQFDEIKSVLMKHINIASIEIEHVGSTSILGLRAKPIIDLDIILEEDKYLMERVINKLNEIGYNHVGDLGVNGREAFKKN